MLGRAVGSATLLCNCLQRYYYILQTPQTNRHTQDNCSTPTTNALSRETVRQIRITTKPSVLDIRQECDGYSINGHWITPLRVYSWQYIIHYRATVGNDAHTSMLEGFDASYRHGGAVNTVQLKWRRVRTIIYTSTARNHGPQRIGYKDW